MILCWRFLSSKAQKIISQTNPTHGSFIISLIIFPYQTCPVGNERKLMPGNIGATVCYFWYWNVCGYRFMLWYIKYLLKNAWISSYAQHGINMHQMMMTTMLMMTDILIIRLNLFSAALPWSFRSYSFPKWIWSSLWYDHYKIIEVYSMKHCNGDKYQVD